MASVSAAVTVHDMEVMAELTGSVLAACYRSTYTFARCKR